jgi:thioredoxin-related protein
MNRSTWIVTVIVVLVLASWAGFNYQSGNAAQRDDARWITLEEAFSRARQERKKVLVDVYTDWCSWCKKMDKDTYADPSIQKILDEKFLTVKLNAESDEEISVGSDQMTKAEFAQRAGVSGYPTTLFFDENAAMLTSVPGYFAPGPFAKVLKFVADEKYRTMNFQDYISGGK